MLYPFSLQAVGLAVGALLIATHLYALVQPVTARKLLLKTPRDIGLGTVLMLIALLWSLWVLYQADFGEYNRLKNILGLAFVAIFFGSVTLLQEHLTARALGVIALLAAQPLLDAAFMRPETSRLLLVVLAYAWIVAGLFWVGVPYLYRDHVNWVAADGKNSRWKAAALGGILYGAVLVGCAILLYG